DKPPIEVAREAGYAVVQERRELAGISSLPLLGLFAMVDMDYDKVRDSGRQPGLAEMTAKAVELLSSDGRGFLLVVEGGRIDHACHKNDADALLGEMAAFDDAVACALEFARRRRDASGNPDTLVVVTADHETGRLRVTADGKLEFGTDGHTDIKVPLFAEGPRQELFAGPLDNTDVPKIIAAAARLTLPESESEAQSVPGAGPVQQPSRRQGHVPVPRRLTVMTYNIHSGIGADLRLDLDRIADLIKAQGADIVGLCEVDQGTKRSGQVDQARYIAERLGYSYVYGPNYMYGGGAFGNALISRYPVVSSRNHPLPNIHLNEPRGLLEAQIDVDGSTLNVFVTHLDVEYADSRLAQARAVVEISSRVVGPKIVMGDFNASPTGTPEIAVMLCHFNDTQQVYRVLVDSTELVKEGLFARDYLKGGYTYDSYDPARRIDYIFTSFDIKVVGDAGAARTPRTLASDHLPYVATIELPSETTVGLPCDAQEPDGKTPVVAVFVSKANEAWYDDMRWDYEDDMDALFELVQGMGLECVRISEEDLALLPRLAAARPSLLILSNARRMSPAQTQAVRDFLASGGRLLATAQTSLKTADELPGGFHGFQLADVLGVSFVGWQGVAPLHGAIAPAIAIPQAGPTAHKDTLPPGDAGRASGVATPVAASATASTLTPAPEPALAGSETDLASQKDALAPGAAPMPVSTPSPSPAPAPGDSNPRSAAISHFLWSGAAAPLRLPKPQAVLVRCLPGAVVLGKWADSSGEATHPDPVNAAIVLRGLALYIGADVLSRDILSDEAVRSFAEKAIRCLLAL
ncbi:MAG: alkaline phosphatase, partial [Bacillota bacterium]